MAYGQNTASCDPLIEKLVKTTTDFSSLSVFPSFLSRVVFLIAGRTVKDVRRVEQVSSPVGQTSCQT